mmetsp:Transcript_6892/g.19946  ORF Transcript_6892/g.19946 Transcript_6892/m.19946 type:complete len:406 (+) Transcript_6892:184-1401(+)
MNRFLWITFVLALLASSTSQSPFYTNALPTEQSNGADEFKSFLEDKNDRTQLEQNKGDNTAPINGGKLNTFNGDHPDEQVPALTSEEHNANEDGNEDLEWVKRRKKNRRTDILVACFFVVAGVWLILATVYSVILLVLLRLQARGELDIYDENLGKMVLCNGRLTIHFGCILRRYAIQLEEDYQRQLQRRFGNSDAENEDDEPQPIRIMTREERRKAVEELLGSSSKTVDVECGRSDERSGCRLDFDCKSIDNVSNTSKKSEVTTTSPDTSFACSEEGPVCSICLVEYEPSDSVFRSKTCPHMFHGECLFSWLERRNNTECPVCRVPLVSDDDIWNVVQRMRKERRNQLRKENGMLHRFVNWVKSKRGNNEDPSLDNEGVESFTAVGSGSEDGDTIERRSSSSSS